MPCIWGLTLARTPRQQRDRRFRRSISAASSNAALRRLALAEMQLLLFADRRFELHDRVSAMPTAWCSIRSATSISPTARAGRAIIPGSLWDENLRGTNAFGLAAAYGAQTDRHLWPRALFLLPWPSELHGRADPELARRDPRSAGRFLCPRGPAGAHARAWCGWRPRRSKTD